MSYDDVSQELIDCFKPETYTELVQIFKEYDKNNNALIEKCEFKDLLKGLGIEDLSKKDMSALFKDIDLNNDNVISFYEFLLIMKKIKT